MKCSNENAKVVSRCTLKASAGYRILFAVASVCRFDLRKTNCCMAELEAFFPKSDLSAFDSSGLNDFNWNHMHYAKRICTAPRHPKRFPRYFISTIFRIFPNREGDMLEYRNSRLIREKFSLILKDVYFFKHSYHFIFSHDIHPFIKKITSLQPLKLLQISYFLYSIDKACYRTMNAVPSRFC